jgi:alpha-mannosidase
MAPGNASTGWTVFVLPSSHNDIGWAGTPSEIAEHRASAIVDSVLSLMEEDSEFAFAIEAGLYLREFAERRPDRLPLISRFLEEGRLEVGGSYIQPYEGLLSGESLVRQIAWGRGWTQKAFGISADGYWNIDVAGRTRQISQILAKSGIRYMVLSRNQPGLYWWEAPDGSRTLVLSFMEGSYGHSPILRPLSPHFSPLEAKQSQVADPAASPRSIAANLMPLLERWEPFFAERDLPRYFLIIAAADYTVPDERLRLFVDTWNEQMDSGELQLPVPVRLRFGNAAQYVAALQEHSDLSRLEVISGELPNPWIYIHGPCHHKTVTAMRQSAYYLAAAELFGSVLDNSSCCPDQAAARDLDLAWLDHLYPDHGYGGLHGEGTDEVFRQKEESALFRARRVARDAMTEIARSVAHRDGTVRNLTVFNALSWTRTEWVETELIFEPGEIVDSISIEDEHGEPVPFQPLEVVRSDSGSLLRLRLGFIARDVPSLGYKAFRLLPGSGNLETAPTSLNSKVPEEFEWSNDFARIRLTRGGMVEWFDKTQRRNLISPDYYLGFEVVEMGSPGHDVGIGERDVAVYDWQANRPFQPTPIGVERTGDRAGDLTILEDGPIRTRVMTQSAFSHCMVTQSFALYHELDRVGVAIDIRRWDGTHGRELRMMVPFGVPEAEISYDVPLGHVVVGQDEAHSFATVRPREVQTWLHASSGRLQGTLSSSVVAHDWIDPLGLTERLILQAILLATKRSCHPKGPWYSQEGNHSFSASMTGSARSLVERIHFGSAAQRPMDVIVTSSDSAAPAAGEAMQQGFLSVEPSNVVISMVRSGDQPFEQFVRCWEVDGVDTVATISSTVPVREAWSCDLLENDLNLLWSSSTPTTPISIDIGGSSIATLKLVLAEPPGPEA